MASSLDNEHRSGQRPARLTRHNSSFIGAIKNIVKAPLTWFANQDDADNNTPGKRRRHLDQEPTEEFIDQQNDVSMYGDDRALESDEEASRRTKRMRLHSPPERTSQPYLDPPAAALRRANPTRRSSVIPRASSAALPSTRVTLSPRRHLPINRTMSIDPPHRPLVRHESSAFNFGPPPASADSVDFDMAIDSYRDISMPPSPGRSPRPSFRLRSSVTPQPPQPQPPARYISEPPPLNTLVSHPVFLRPPAQHAEASRSSVPPTLGALVDSVRATKSPTRQQHSALFLGPTIHETNENKNAPAERALHQLDVYKTPLLPTRMRSSNLPASITATTTPDMFKSRRKSHLVLMQDDKDRLGRKGTGSGRGSVVNETKPYAGEGGMKKLLARRKQEAEAEEDNEHQEQQEKETADNRTPRLRQPSPVVSARVIPDPSAPAGDDWFSTAAPSSSGSSLRVGRSTNRNHLARPAKSRFSAKYDEDADVEDSEGQRAERRREMVEEAAKMVPLFKEPAGFSFSLEAPPMEASKDDDPNMFPISSLPFSIIKSSTSSSQDSSPKPSLAPSTVANKDPILSQGTPAPVAPPATVQIPVIESKIPAVSSSILSVPPVPAPTSNGGLPNFFATSKLLKETKLPPPPPVMNFASASLPTPPTITPSSFSISLPSVDVGVRKPVNEAENPFWDGSEKKKPVEEPKLFSGFGNKDSPTNSSSSSVPHTSPFGSGSTNSAFAPIPKASTESTSSTPASAPSISFDKSAAVTLPFGVASNSTNDAVQSCAAPTNAKLAPPDTVAPKPMFVTGVSGSSLFGDSSKVPATNNLFGTSAPPQTTPSPLSFSFGAPPTQPQAGNSATSSQLSFFGASVTTASAAEAPKSLFGGPSNTGFSFGQSPAEKKEEVKAPFSFSAAPSTPPITSVATSKPAASTAFTFGQPSTTPAGTPPISFSFSGGGSTSSDVSSKSLFAFGQTGTATSADRPVTPPKNENEFRMEESPTRELQQANSKPPEPRPTIGGGPFAFGSASSATNGSFFGSQQAASSAAATAPFSFAPTTSNPFAPKESNSQEPKTFGGFGQSAAPVAPTITTSFSFGQTKPADDSQRPLSGGGFGFGTTPTSTTTSSTPFNFGVPSTTSPFGQPAASGSAPSSPSTFNQPSPFAFGAATAPSTTSGFTFGSQPASPAAGNLTLPASGFGSGTSFGQPQQPSSPFSGPIALAPSTSGGGGGGSLFTIGAAPTPTAGGARTIKKLPNRRGVGTKR